jgi:hypothetical protein
VPEIRHEGGHAALAETCGAVAQHSGHANAGVYNPSSIGGTHVIYVLHDATNPGMYGGLPSNRDSRNVHDVEAVRQAYRPARAPGAPVAFFHYIAEGPKISLRLARSQSHDDRGRTIR